MDCSDGICKAPPSVVDLVDDQDQEAMPGQLVPDWNILVPDISGGDIGPPPRNSHIRKINDTWGE